MNNELFKPLKDLVMQRVEEKGQPFRVGMILSAGDFHMMNALGDATKEGWLKIVFYGDEEVFNSVLMKTEMSREHCVLVDAIDRENRVIAMTEAAMEGGLAAICIAPDAATRNFALFKKEREHFFSSDEPGSGITALAMPGHNRLLFVADTISNALPTVQQRIAITKHVIDTAVSCGIDEPKVAILAVVESVNEGIPGTVEARKVAEKVVLYKNAIVEGPVSLDLAVNKSAVEKKKAKGLVLGKADCLVGSNLTVSRSIYQASVTLCDAKAGTILIGGVVPVAMPGRTEGAEGLYFSTLLAAAMAN